MTDETDIYLAVKAEVDRAEAKFAPLNSAHEGYGVLAEEFRELEEHVFVNEKRRDVPAMRTEAIQVAAMAIRFVRDICDGRNGKSANQAEAIHLPCIMASRTASGGAE